MHPAQLTGPGIEGHHRAPRARGRVERAADHERCAFQLELGSAAKIVGLESPRDFELIEVGGGDLVERRIARAAGVAGVLRPFAVARARQTRLTGDPHGGQRGGNDERRWQQPCRLR